MSIVSNNQEQSPVFVDARVVKPGNHFDLNFFDLVPGPLLSAQESVTLLTQAGLFDNAFTVAFHFNLPKETIFEGLASR